MFGCPCGSKTLALAVSAFVVAALCAAPPLRAQSPAAGATADAGCARAITYPTPNPRITVFQYCADTPEMIAFRGGRYRMGDADGHGMDYEQPVHEVGLRAFAIGRYEVTRAEWQACQAAGACSDPHKPPPEGVVDGGRYPVTGVSWTQVQDYLVWLRRHTGRGYRLPSESEWEYAARAGATGRVGWDTTQQAQQACRYANLLDFSGSQRHPELGWSVSCDDGYAEVAPVGRFLPNAWGVHDMQGNVWEWVEDCWHPGYAGAPADGSAWTTGGTCRKRVNRGGGWGNGLTTLRLSNRDADPVDGYSDGLGFRVALGVATAASPTMATTGTTTP